jgi:hypothetical protein
VLKHFFKNLAVQTLLSISTVDGIFELPIAKIKFDIIRMI